MFITKRGDPKKTDRLKEFSCSECGCEWFAGPHEVYRTMAGMETACYCPECHELCRAQDETAKKA